MHPTALNVETLDSFLSALQSIPLHHSAAYRSVTLIAADVVTRLSADSNTHCSSRDGRAILIFNANPEERSTE